MIIIKRLQIRSTFLNINLQLDNLKTAIADPKHIIAFENYEVNIWRKF